MADGSNCRGAIVEIQSSTDATSITRNSLCPTRTATVPPTLSFRSTILDYLQKLDSPTSRVTNLPQLPKLRTRVLFSSPAPRVFDFTRRSMVSDSRPRGGAQILDSRTRRPPSRIESSNERKLRRSSSRPKTVETVNVVCIGWQLKSVG